VAAGSALSISRLGYRERIQPDIIPPPEDYIRAVTTATAAVVLATSRKSLDNLLARLAPESLPEGRQGRERRIPIALLEELALTIELRTHMNAAAEDAYACARQLLGRDRLTQEFIGAVRLGDFLQVGIDLQAFRASLHSRLERAIESHVRPRRGRPPVHAAPRPDLGDA
jgi:hypothetical protein